MKPKLKWFQARLFCAVALGIDSSFCLAAAAADSADTAETSIPWSQLGAKAGTDHQGDGLAVIPIADGARLRCVFQRLEGQATREGLWLSSTVTNAVNDRFRVAVCSVERAQAFGVRRQSAAATPLFAGEQSEEFRFGSESGVALRFPPQSKPFSRTGSVSTDGQTVRFVRPGLTEEYTVSIDGLRQDFMIEQRPVGAGPLRVELVVAGAKVEPLADGARLVLDRSGRKIAYSRLRVTDAKGQELTARMEV